MLRYTVPPAAGYDIVQDELLPMPNDHTLNYTELHYELERWSLFRALPLLYMVLPRPSMLLDNPKF